MITDLMRTAHLVPDCGTFLDLEISLSPIPSIAEPKLELGLKEFEAKGEAKGKLAVRVTCLEIVATGSEIHDIERIATELFNKSISAINLEGASHLAGFRKFVLTNLDIANTMANMVETLFQLGTYAKNKLRFEITGISNPATKNALENTATALFNEWISLSGLVDAIKCADKRPDILSYQDLMVTLLFTVAIWPTPEDEVKVKFEGDFTPEMQQSLGSIGTALFNGLKPLVDLNASDSHSVETQIAGDKVLINTGIAIAELFTSGTLSPPPIRSTGSKVRFHKRPSGRGFKLRRTQAT